jgi:hypothetical protein
VTDWTGRNPSSVQDTFRRTLHDAEISVAFASIGVDALERALGADPCDPRAKILLDLRSAFDRLRDNVRTLSEVSAAIFWAQSSVAETTDTLVQQNSKNPRRGKP